MDEALLAARYGVYRDREAGAFGIRRRRDGAPVGHPMTRGVRCLLPPPWTVEARRTGAVLGGGVGALLAGDSWLEAFGIDTPSPFAPVTVLIRHGCVKHATRLAVYQRSRVLEPASHRERSFLTAALARDVGVASARSVVVHAGASFVHTELRGLLATLTQTGVTSPGAVIDFARLHPRLPGAAAARRVALDLANGADSEGEFQFLELARAAGLPADRGHVKIFRHGRVLSTTDGWWRPAYPASLTGHSMDGGPAANGTTRQGP